MIFAAQRTILALLLLTAIIAGCAAPTSPPPSVTPPPSSTATAEPTPALGQALALRVGQAVSVGEVTVTLLEIADDSRCPARVACAWEGAATALVQVAVDGQDQGQQRLTLYGQNRETEESRAAVAGYTVRLVRLDPYPDQPQPIAPADYVAQVIVEHGAAAYTAVGDGTYDGVIVPEQDADAFDPRADGYWTPRAGDVRAFEAGLAAFLQASRPAQSPDLWQKQAAYKRQYAGLVRGGRRLVYASFFCETGGDAWRSQALLVMDGGDCFFQLTYDVARGTYSDLLVNGDA